MREDLGDALGARDVLGREGELPPFARPKERKELLGVLKARFEKIMNRHQGLEWPKVQTKLEADAGKLWSLNEMERTGGEPDIVRHDPSDGRIHFL